MVKELLYTDKHTCNSAYINNGVYSIEDENGNLLHIDIYATDIELLNKAMQVRKERTGKYY